MAESLASWVFGAFGLALGLAADRLATRWPEHDEEHPPGRRMDWRTVVVGATGAVAFGLLPLRLGSDPLVLGLFALWFAALVVGLATDLDQRLLPNETTLPVVPIALLFALSGRNREDVTPVTTEAYYAGQAGLSPRPLRSVMDLSKIEATGFVPEDAMAALRRYLAD